MNGMKRRLFVVKAILLVCLIALSLPVAVHAQEPPSPWPPPPICNEETLGDQLILVCIPPGTADNPFANWNGQLVVYAHGYVAPQLPLMLPSEELSAYPHLLPVLLSQGFAFATSSYSKNGYAVEQAGKDLNALVRHFKTHILPNAGLLQKVFLVGASEGGLITTMLVEKHPDIYDGGLAMCGPIGGMPYQVQYLADFRVVFDYFFPGVLPGDVANVPADAWGSWGDYEDAIAAAIALFPANTAQLFNVTQAAYVPGVPASYIGTAQWVLYYNIWGTNDLLETAGGMPYDNQDTWYIGSWDDDTLNAAVDRVESDGRARAYVRRAYQPNGELERPLVTLHNSLDPAVPFQHELIYGSKAASSGLFFPTEVMGYGHCNFTAAEVLAHFNFLVTFP